MRKIIIQTAREQRKKRVSSRLFGTAKRPRVIAYRSNRYLYLQVVNDEERKTIFSHFSNKKKESAIKLGEEVAKKLLKKGIKMAVFDRNRFAYHGRVKAAAEGLRKGGIVL